MRWRGYLLVALLCAAEGANLFIARRQGAQAVELIAIALLATSIGVLLGGRVALWAVRRP
jgi:hypothetical protein